MILILFFLIGAIFLLKKDLRTYLKKDKIKVYIVILCYFIFMLYYTNYINEHSYSVGYGIPGADMLAHFLGAEKLSQGARWSDLALVARRFEEISISTIGYFLYTTFIYITVFFLPIFPIGFNVYLLYLFQILLSVDACIKFSKVFSSDDIKSKPINYFIALSLCIPFVVQACQLMRDVYFMWFIALLLEITVMFKKSGKNDTKSRTIFVLKIVFLTFVSILLRYYTILIIAPLFFYFYDKKKLAFIITIVEFGTITFGTTFIMLIKDNFGIFWEMTPPNINESVSFLMFPNIFNQSKYLFNWNYYFGSSIDISGCNVPGVYFFMSVWNVIYLPFAFVGVFSNFKTNKYKNLTYLLLLLTVVALYSVTYDAIDTRHKFFMSIPITFLSVQGYGYLKRISKKLSLFVNLGIAVFLLMTILISI